MTIVGIDPSVTQTGVVAGRVGDPLEWTLVDTRPKRGQQKVAEPGRMSMICEQVADFVDRTRPLIVDRPLLLVIEDYIGARGYGLVNIGLHWLLRATVADAWSTETLVVAPATLKLFATGKGNADKGTVGACVQKRWGECLPREPTDEHVLDALALWELGRCWAERGEGDWTQYQRDAALRGGKRGERVALADTDSIIAARGHVWTT